MFGSFGITESSVFTAKGRPFRVPTASLKPGVLEKTRKGIPVQEKSWNFAILFKNSGKDVENPGKTQNV